MPRSKTSRRFALAAPNAILCALAARQTRRGTLPRRLAAPVAILCALAVSACGSSKPASTEIDPATVVPSSAAVYVAAVVQPEGTLKQNATADAKALTHLNEPFVKLIQALASSSQMPSFDFAKEVKPWLGRNAGLFATATGPLAAAAESMLGGIAQGGSTEALLKSTTEGLLTQGTLQGALVLDTSDVSKARAFLSKLAQRGGAHTAHYKGISYEVSPHGWAEGIVGKLVVLGSEEGLQSVIDTHAGGASLAKSSQPYRTLTAKTPSETLISAYIDLAGASSAGQADESGSNGGGGAGGGEQAGAATGGGKQASAGTSALTQLLPGEPSQMLVSLQPLKSSIAIDADTLSASASAQSEATAADAAAAGLVAKLPAGSWLAAGVGDTGKHLSGYLSALHGVVSVAGSSLLSSFGGEALEKLFDRLSKHASALQSAFAGWAGPAAVFVSGAGLLDIQAGLVIESSSPASAVGAVSELGATLASAGATVAPTTIAGAESALEVHITGFPLTIDIGAGSGLLVIGAGPASVQAMLVPSGETLSQAPLYRAASSQLGGHAKPVAIFDFPSLLAFIEGIGLNESPSIAPALAYLRSLGTLAASEQSLGSDVSRLHAVLELQHGG